MFMRTCPDLGLGMGRFSSLRASGPPGAWSTAARIVEGIALIGDLERAWKIECDRMKKLIRRLGMRFVLATILGSCWKWAIIRSQINVGNWRGKGL